MPRPCLPSRRRPSEWALHAARYADEAQALDPSQLAAIPPDQTPWLVLRLDPSVSYVDSRWPIAAIWRANQPEGDNGGPVDLAAGGAQARDPTPR